MPSDGTASSHASPSATPRPAHGHGYTDTNLERAFAQAAKPRSGGALFLRYVAALIGALAVVGILGGVFYGHVKQAMAMAPKMAPPPPTVTTSIVKAASWQPTLRSVGSLEAVQGVTVSADLPGVVKEILFESGAAAKAGDVLVRLNTDQEQADLEASAAMRDLSVFSLRRQRELVDKKASSQSDFDTAEAQQRQAEAQVADKKAAIARKTIRAPFDGKLGIRQINVGQYLNSGDPIVPLQAIDPILVNFTLPQQNLDTIHAGTEVQVTTDATGDTVFKGKINAINSMVDKTTRNFQTQATLTNPDGKLRPGMFVNVEVILPGDQKVLPVPASAINYAPYGNSVFVLKNEGEINAVDGKPQWKVYQKFVKLGPTRGDLVAVLSGLEAGEEVATSGVFKLQNQAPARVNNSVKPGENSDPNPEES